MVQHLRFLVKRVTSAGKTYADYQKLSIAAHDKATKKNKKVLKKKLNCKRRNCL